MSADLRATMVDETDPYFVLEFARAAIADAIGLEDGLDPKTGSGIIQMIDDSLAARPSQENIGISQTTSRASRPAVESDGSALAESEETDAEWLRGLTELIDYGCNICGDAEDDRPMFSPEAKARLERIAAELSTRDPVSRTLGATDSPREDSTDVDQLALLRAQLSSTRTALQRVREAATALLTAWDETDMDNPSTAFLDAFANLRALTSSETDQ